MSMTKQCEDLWFTTRLATTLFAEVNECSVTALYSRDLSESNEGRRLVMTYLCNKTERLQILLRIKRRKTIRNRK